MALKKTTEKLNQYQKRLKQKKAKPIKRKHVEKVLEKLQSKRSKLETELEAAKKPSKRDRIRAKMRVVEELQVRAEWLLKKIDKSK